MKFKELFKHLEKYIIIAIAVIVIALDIFNITSSSIVFEAILAVLALLMFSLIKLESKIDKIRTENKQTNFSTFYSDRDELPTFEESLSKAKTEIVIWAACLGSVIVRLKLLKNKIDQHCKVNILLMALEDENGNNNPVIKYVSEISKNTGFENRLKIAHKELIEFYNSLSEPYKKYLEIKIYMSFPTATYLFVDKDTNKGFIRVEPNLIGFWADELPSYEVTPYQGSNLYSVLNRSLSEIWSKSKSLI